MTTSTRWTTRPSTKSSRPIGAVHSPPFGPCIRCWTRLTGAVVVNISSVSAVTGQGSNVAYCASKAALDSMTRSLARALAPSVRVVSVSPGWVVGEYADRMPPEVLDAQREATPLERLATPDDVARAVSAAVNDLPFTTGRDHQRRRRSAVGSCMSDYPTFDAVIPPRDFAGG